MYYLVNMPRIVLFFGNSVMYYLPGRAIEFYHFDREVLDVDPDADVFTKHQDMD